MMVCNAAQRFGVIAGTFSAVVGLIRLKSYISSFFSRIAFSTASASSLFVQARAPLRPCTNFQPGTSLPASSSVSTFERIALHQSSIRSRQAIFVARTWMDMPSTFGAGEVSNVSKSAPISSCTYCDNAGQVAFALHQRQASSEGWRFFSREQVPAEISIASCARWKASVSKANSSSTVHPHSLGADVIRGCEMAQRTCLKSPARANSCIAPEAYIINCSLASADTSLPRPYFRSTTMISPPAMMTASEVPRASSSPVMCVKGTLTSTNSSPLVDFTRSRT